MDTGVGIVYSGPFSYRQGVELIVLIFRFICWHRSVMVLISARELLYTAETVRSGDAWLNFRITMIGLIHFGQLKADLNRRFFVLIELP
jgi:hypothetical protein